MKPAYVVLHIYKGQTFRDKVILQAPDGTPIDLPALYDGARMQARPSIDSPIVELNLSTADGTLELTSAGEIVFNISAAATSAIVMQADYLQWVYDLELFKGTGPAEVVDRPIEGTIVVWPEVTRAIV